VTLEHRRDGGAQLVVLGEDLADVARVQQRLDQLIREVGDRLVVNAEALFLGHLLLDLLMLRVVEAALGGEVLGVIRQLAVGADVLFEDRLDVELDLVSSVGLDLDELLREQRVDDLALNLTNAGVVEAHRGS